MRHDTAVAGQQSKKLGYFVMFYIVSSSDGEKGIGK